MNKELFWKLMDESREADARASIAILSQRRRNSAKKHSGFWRDLAVRKRRTEVDSLMGTVIELAERTGISTPAPPGRSPDRKSTRLNSSHPVLSRMPSSA